MTKWLKDLLDQIPGSIKSMKLDKVYDDKKCYETIVARSAIPVISFRKGTKKGAVEARNQATQKI